MAVVITGNPIPISAVEAVASPAVAKDSIKNKNIDPNSPYFYRYDNGLRSKTIEVKQFFALSTS